MSAIDFKADLPEFREKTAAFYAGEMTKQAYKGFSGYYGSYAQKGAKASMLRLRMPAGRVTPQRLAFVARAIRRHGVQRIHFTTCQTIQLHDLTPDAVCAIIEEALDAGIVTMGGGGDFPRNVMCSPLSGVEPGEHFNVLPYAQAAGDYLLSFIKAEKMPRKLKVGFSNSPANLTHATYRDLGFAARADGRFDVYSAGGLGNNPRFGVKVAEGVEPQDILPYIKAMWLTFRAYGNYENRGKARTRYMQEALGGAEAYKAAYLEKLAQVRESGEDLSLHVEPEAIAKAGDGTQAQGPRVLAQKQPGLYAVAYHPLGGQPELTTFLALCDALAQMPGAELRLSPDEGAFIVNLTGEEAGRVLELTEKDSAAVALRDVGQLHRRGDLPGRRARFAGAAACLCAGRARGGASGWRAPADSHLRLPLLLRHASDGQARLPRRRQARGRQAAAGVRALRRRRGAPGRGGDGPRAGRDAGRGHPRVPRGAGKDRYKKRP